MPISKKQIISVSNSAVANSGSTPIELMQAAEATQAASQTIFTVATTSALPSAIENKGRIAWVSDIEEYRYSDGIVWLSELSSSIYYINSIWAWGNNGSGRLGDDSLIDRSSPVSVVGGFTDWCQVASGCATSAAIRTNGTLWTWGGGTSGATGDGTTITKSSPASIVGGFTDWCQVSAGGSFMLAVRTNGTLWSWGRNISGGLGDGFSTSRSSPVSVVGGFTDWKQASAGLTHSVAVRTNGTVWAWGCNSCGQTGDLTTVSKSSPVSVVGGFTDWCQVSAGSLHTAAIRANGTAWSWGNGTSGELGDSSIVTKSSPVSVVGGFTDWCQVSAGNAFSVAVRTNGTLWAWGSGQYGRLGNNNTSTRSSPVSVVGGFTDWCQVSSGLASSVAVRTNGTIWAWGCNPAGQLGDGTTVSRSSPVSVVGGFTDWCQVSMWSHAIGVRKQQIGF